MRDDLTTIQVPKTLRSDIKQMAKLTAARKNMRKLSMVDYLQGLIDAEKAKA
jgi:hypothetical protein